MARAICLGPFFRRRTGGYALPRYRWGRRPSPFALFLLIFITLALAFINLEASVRPSLAAAAAAKANAVGGQAIQEAIAAVLGQGVSYQSLVHFEYDQQGRVSTMQPNTTEINRIYAQIYASVLGRVQEIETVDVRIPLGMALGSELLATVGPTIRVHLRPVGQVHVTIQDKFEQAGINQTRHVIYVKTEFEVQYIVPFLRGAVTVQSQNPIADAVIVGPVPSTYVNFSIIGR